MEVEIVVGNRFEKKKKVSHHGGNLWGSSRQYVVGGRGRGRQ